MTRRDILETAIKCVCGDRDLQYGSPEDNFTIIADFWQTYLRSVCENKNISIMPEDVASMMALFKIARIATGTSKADSFVDGCGYLACGGEIATRKTSKP